MKCKTTGRVIVLLVLTLAFAGALSTTAMATVISNRVVFVGPNGTTPDLKAMSDTSATAEILKVVPATSIGTMTLRCNSASQVMSWSMLTKGDATKNWRAAVQFNPVLVIQDAKLASKATTLTLSQKYYSTDLYRSGVPVALTALSRNPRSFTKAQNAYLKVSKGVLVCVPAVNYSALDYVKARNLVDFMLKKNASAAAWSHRLVPLNAWCGSQDKGGPAIVIKKASVTGAMLNDRRTFVVSISGKTVTLYKGVKPWIVTGCATGSPGHPTPPGVAYVYMKAWKPNWYNPGSAWAANMPSVIYGSDYAPLGRAACYLYYTSGARGDVGVRIHGTANTGSIGTAASHGCIRLRNRVWGTSASDVNGLYSKVPLNTVVYVLK